MGILLSAPAAERTSPETGFAWSRLLPQTVVIGSIAMALSVLADWGVARAVFGDRQAPQASKHIRFRPDATATTAKPKPGVPHP